MCMKYLNSTVGCYKSVTMVDDNIVSLNVPFDRMVASKANEDQVSIGEFYVVTKFNMLGTNKEENKHLSTLEKREKLHVKVRLTKCDKDENNQRYIDLDDFVIDLDEEENKRNIHKACFPYFNYRRITRVETLNLPLGCGPYVIKILVKESADDKYTVQAMNYLLVTTD